MRTFELGSRDARATPETRDACALLPRCASLAGAGTRSRCTRGTGPVCTAGSAPAPAAPASPAAPLAEAQRTQALWSPTADQRRAREGAHSPPSSADMRACWAAPRRHNARPRGLPSPRGGGCAGNPKINATASEASPIPVHGRVVERATDTTPGLRACGGAPCSACSRRAAARPVALTAHSPHRTQACETPDCGQAKLLTLNVKF